MKDPEALVAIVAQRCGVTFNYYITTRTLRDFRLDCAAWLNSWLRPVGMMMSSFGLSDKESKDKPKGVSHDGLPSHYRRMSGYTYTTHELGRETGPAPTLEEKQRWAQSTGALRKTLTDMHQTRNIM